MNKPVPISLVLDRKGLTSKFLLITCLLLAGFSTYAQEVLDYGVPEKYESKVMVVTNRDLVSVDSNQIVFDVKQDSNHQLSFLTSYYADSEWSFVKRKTIDSLYAEGYVHQDWLVFVHGDGKTLLAAVDRAREIQEMYKVNVMVFSWPSRDPELGAIKNFKNSYSIIENSTVSFAKFINLLNDQRNDDNGPFRAGNLSLFLHSLGNYYLARMYEDNLFDGLNDEVFDNLIINAAAVESEGHHEWVENINFSRRIYINSNDDDFSLSGLRVLTRLGRQLGERPSPPFASNANYVNFTDAVGFAGMGPSHSYYFAASASKSDNIRSYYKTIFHGYEAPLKNSGHFAYVPELEGYLIKF